jgi:hypothetical protein
VKLSILGTEYDYGKALQKAKLDDLSDLHDAAKIGIRAITAMLFKLDDAKTVEARLAVSEQSDVLRATQGLVFLCRRYAGEKISYADSAVAWEDLAWVIEDSDLEAAEPDPTQASTPAKPARGSNGTEGNGLSKKSKTSKPLSTAASS